MTTDKVKTLAMTTRTHQELLNRMGSLGGADGINVANALSGIAVQHDEALLLHQVTIHFREPYIRASVSVTLAL